MRDKQIEEMRKDLIEIFDEEYEKRRLITPQNTSEKLTAKGYRKASDVAREIFEEIAKILCRYDKLAEKDGSEYGELIIMDIGCAISELKKKYTEDTK